MLTKRELLRSGALTAITIATTKSFPASAQTSADRPGFFKAKDIAEAGFIYGLPIVMNYASCTSTPSIATRDSSRLRSIRSRTNPTSSPTKIQPFARRTATLPIHSYGWTCGRSRWSFRSRRWTRSATTRSCSATAILTTTAISAPGRREASRRLHGGRAGLEGCDAAGIKKVFRSSTQFSRGGISHPAFQPGRPRQRQESAGWLQGADAVRLPEAGAAATCARYRLSEDRQGTREDATSSTTSTLRCNSRPLRQNEKEIRAQLARIGVGPGKTFNFKDLSLEDKLEIGLGMKEGDRKVDEAVAKFGKDDQRLARRLAPGDSAHYNGDWLMRAIAAKAGIYGNDAVEAMYPLTRLDSDGQTLDGSKNNYTLTFPAGKQPPVNAFWSLTMYDGKTQLLIENPINRYLINSPMLPGMKTNSDGSLTLYIQNKSPGADKEANWLPAPNGTIYLVMRLYWPKTTPPSILPAGQGNMAAARDKANFLERLLSICPLLAQSGHSLVHCTCPLSGVKQK